MIRLSAAVLTMAALGCSDHVHDHAREDERPALSYTHWSEDTELFMELRALVVGQDSPCAAHVSKLAPFAALAGGTVTVILRGPTGDERFSSGEPSPPGIFRPVVRPAAPGTRRLLVEIRGTGLATEHDLGDATVFESAEAARAAAHDEPATSGRITFLKEQQWAIEFATAVVTGRAVRPTLRVSGVIRPRADGDVVVTAPVAGRVASSERPFPRMGERVNVNDVLQIIAPRLEAADLPSLELALTSASLEQRFTERERQRLEALRNEGAVPERRLQDAVKAEEGARAAVAAAQRRLDQFRRVERPTGSTSSGVQVRAPLSGAITEVVAAPGAFVETGAPLLRVTDLTQVWLDARVPAVDVAKVSDAHGAWFIPEGSDAAIDVAPEALVARGQVIDESSHTLPLVFAVDNTASRLPIGVYCRVYIVNGEEHAALTVPDSALVDDAGASVVYVQAEGESFERRIVRTGARDRGYIEVTQGLSAGEHIVARGAWSVKLAASSGAVPAHGHSH